MPGEDGIMSLGWSELKLQYTNHILYIRSVWTEWGNDFTPRFKLKHYSLPFSCGTNSFSRQPLQYRNKKLKDNNLFRRKSIILYDFCELAYCKGTLYYWLYNPFEVIKMVKILSRAIMNLVCTAKRILHVNMKSLS